MIKKNLSNRHLLAKTCEINNLFEQLHRQVTSLGYPETSMFIKVAKESFEHELFEQVKRN